MPKIPAKNPKKKVPAGWSYHATDEKDFEVFVDKGEKHSGSQCATLRSIVEQPKPFGNLMQYFSAEKYVGKRVRMTAWVKTNLVEGKSQLWVRVDGDWKSGAKAGCFDNMDDRPIKAKTDWKKYELVVNIPEKSSAIAFGLMLLGKGQVWLDDVSFEEVGADVPLTGKYADREKRAREPVNLNFEDLD
ncbi:MAG: hypothetical protein KGS72_17170 [Cyanobacteria bacterium REEB67]|nr:hypothetical protein [Cyanobacteria bacterium REEB67]